MFRSPTDPVAQELLDQIKALSRQVATLQGEQDYINERRELVDEKLTLQADIETLKIERDRREEEFARKQRDVEHATGLHRRQSEWEREKAVEQAKLEVQKGNLDADRVRFEEQMKFHREQIAGEIARFEKMLQDLMTRLPTVTIEKSIALTGNGNGH